MKEASSSDFGLGIFLWTVRIDVDEVSQICVFHFCSTLKCDKSTVYDIERKVKSQGLERSVGNDRTKGCCTVSK